MSIIKLFVEGGAGGMCIISVFLIGLFFAAWKAPAWVKEIGLAGLAAGVMFTLIAFRQIGIALETHGQISPGVTWGGVKVALIPIIYGIIIYFISLVIRVIQKPRI